MELTNEERKYLLRILNENVDEHYVLGDLEDLNLCKSILLKLEQK